MSTIRILNWPRNLCVFFVCILPISCCAGFWDSLFGENPIEDTESIFEAIQKERLGNVERLLARGAFLEERNSKGLTPLLYAIRRLEEKEVHKGNLEKIILALIEQGAFLESTDSDGNTPLLSCCTNFNNHHLASLNKAYLEHVAYLPVLANILLEHGADLEARNQKGETPLFMAAMNGKIDVLKVLIAKNADKEVRDNKHQTALMIAAEKNQVKAVDELLAAGAFVDPGDEKGMTPLMRASYKGNLAIIQILLQYNADLGSTSTRDVAIVSKSDLYQGRIVIPTGSTALTFAEKIGGRGAEKLLLEAWAKRDPAMERVLIEWREKVALF